MRYRDATLLIHHSEISMHNAKHKKILFIDLIYLNAIFGVLCILVININQNRRDLEETHVIYS